jgi:hypothetical protein
VAEEVRRELNRVLVLYSQNGFYKERPDLLDKLKQLLEVDLGEAEELAKARSKELSKYSDANMGTKAYAASSIDRQRRDIRTRGDVAYGGEGSGRHSAVNARDHAPEGREYC